MSATSLLAIDSPSMQLTAKFIQQLLHNSYITCKVCSRSIELGLGNFVAARSCHSIDHSYFVCSICSAKNKKGVASGRVLPFRMLYDMLCTFNCFDMREITNGCIQNIMKRIDFNTKISEAEREQNKRLLQYYLISSQVSEQDYGSFASKYGFVVTSLRCFVNQIESHHILSYWFRPRSLGKGFSQDKVNLLTGMMRHEISIKLQTLKLLHQYLKNYNQPLGFRHICKQACSMMKAPLQTFLKTKQTQKNVIFSISRREIQLKSQEQCSLKPQEYESIKQLVRLNEPMRSQGIVFRLKCLTSLQAAVRVGFYFMKHEDYAAEVQYEKFWQPFTVNLLVIAGSIDDSKTEKITEFSAEMARYQPEKNKFFTILSNQCKTEVKFQNAEEEMSAMSGKKSHESGASQAKEVASETKIELKYQKSSSSFSIQTLSTKQILLKKKFYNKKMSSELKTIEVFPCVILTGPNCSVQYVVEQTK